MSVELKLVFASVQEAANALAKLGAPTTAAPTPAAPEKAASPKAEAKKESAGTQASSSAAAAASPAPAESKADAAEKPKADVPTYEKSGLPEKIKTAVGKDKAGVVALLKEFGVSKGPELKPEQFAAFGEKIDALLAGGDLA